MIHKWFGWWPRAWQATFEPVSTKFVDTYVRQSDKGPFLLGYMNFNPSINKQLHPLKSAGWNYLSIPKISTVGPLNFGNG